ncbi:MAG: tetratricopeptide repeat protein [Prevotella sp.]|nr:tetratricopeptide repeat protein [Prevotella sp.]
MKKLLLVAAFFCSLLQPIDGQKHSDTEQLGRALEYFTSGKYHEALLIFQRLDKEYKLNARFRAYIGLCYYYEWDFKEACQYLDELIPQLNRLAPHERSVYYYANAESHFNLQQYEKAIPYYEQTLTVCYEREKGDALYKLGFCYMFAEKWENARDYFVSSEQYYLQHRNTPDLEARLTQIANMIKGCDKHISTACSHPQNSTEEDPLQSQ